MTHKGFCRVAIDTGVPVVPIYCLGNTALFNVVGLKRLSRRFRVGLQLFWGRAFLPLPRQSKIVVVLLRNPHPVPRAVRPATPRMRRVSAELQRLFHQHKHRLEGWENREMVVVHDHDR